MMTVQKKGIILEKTPRPIETQGVINLTAINKGENVHTYYPGMGKDHCSTIGYRLLDNSALVAEQWNRSITVADIDFESFTTENPEIVKHDSSFCFSYKGYDMINSRVALAISEELKQFSKVGILATLKYEFIPGSKIDEKISGRYYNLILSTGTALLCDIL